MHQNKLLFPVYIHSSFAYFLHNNEGKDDKMAFIEIFGWWLSIILSISFFISLLLLLKEPNEEDAPSDQ
ncbi:hypothetical protein CW755_17390 [Geobacillus thermodenitrificans]|jgi:hypothetical protein|nr:hypothetical protein GD3902_16045 [Geobacillus thermodenitrificans]OQP07051.1 hypothetical protein B1691_16910 [Geobacillus sp. 47C-IIb]ATO38779.1 hypothetical protein GTID1_17310 [Geobacillus thermodenitrificans]MED0662171.1 hypothetical protein [Geobacillus thermodenitrificans]PJW19147.1 hypothetical protein CV632_17705 [Geobacillus thermodenitrificans]